MFKKLDLFTIRSLQISMAFILFVFVEKFFNIPHSIWIIMTGTMVYTGFHPGTVVKRAYLRLTGTIVGVAAVGIMWHFIHIDYRLIFILFALLVWINAFFLLLPYNRFIICFTLFSDIIFELSNSDSFYLQDYILDRLVCTFIAFIMCIALEYLWFGNSNTMYLSYLHSRSNIKAMITELYQMVQSKTLNTTKILQKIHFIRAQIEQLDLLLSDAKYESKRRFNQFQLTAKDKTFNWQIAQLFRKIISIYYLQKADPTHEQLPQLIQQVEAFLDSKHD